MEYTTHLTNIVLALAVITAFAIVLYKSRRYETPMAKYNRQQQALKSIHNKEKK